DCFLGTGEYSYYVKTYYLIYDSESASTNNVSVTIEEIKLLPFEESFENAGYIPAAWSQIIPSTDHPSWEFVTQSYNGITGYEVGEYFAYLRGNPISTVLSNPNHESSVLKTAMFDLSSYESVNISYDFITQSTPDGLLSDLKLYIVNDKVNTGTKLLICENTGNYSEWQGTDWIPVPIQALTDSCHFEFHGTSFNDQQADEAIASVFLDYIWIMGEVLAYPPSNIKIINNQSFITLSWDPVPNARSYHIYRSENPDRNFTEIAVVTPLNYGNQILPTSYTDIIKKPSSNPHTGTTSITPAVDTILKPYYYKIATEVLPSSSKTINTK
ncbi:MAG: hypothetical protein KKD38_10290, partial [Candidatus Delongbacteria bacterium]|nr:hypothetical protein [Candidatus Delongbacteria bacterium]